MRHILFARPLPGRRPATCLAVAVAALTAGPAAAQKFWRPTGTESNYYWSVPGNWSPAAVPAAGDVLTFDAGSGANLSSVNNLSALSIGGLAVTNPSAAVNIAGNAFTLSGTGNAIDLAPGATQDLTIITPVLSVAATSSTWRVADAGRTLTVNGNVANGAGVLNLGASASDAGNVVINGVFGSYNGGAGGLAVNTAGTVTIGGTPSSAAAPFLGTTITSTGAANFLAGGTLRLAPGSTRALTAANAVTFGATSGVLDLNGNAVAIGNLTSTSATAVVQFNANTTTTLTLVNGAIGTFAGTFANGGSEAVNLVKAGATALTLTNASSLNLDTLDVQNGSLILANNAGLLTVGQFTGSINRITVRGGGTLQAGDAAAANNTAPRLPSIAPLTLGDATLGGGTFTLGVGTTANGTVTQQFTSLTLAPGLSTLTSVGSSPSGVNLLQFTDGTAPLADRPAGALLNVIPNGTIFNVNFPTAPTLTASGLLGNGGVLASSNDWATLITAAGPTPGNVVAVGTAGAAASYTTQNTASSWTSAAANYLTTTAVSGTAGGEGVTIGSLKLAAAAPQVVTVDPAGLVIGSGGVLVASGVGANQTVLTGGPLASGNGRDLVLFNNNAAANPPLFVRSAVTNNPAGPAAPVGLTKGGVGNVVLGFGRDDATANAFTGPAVFTQGTTFLAKGANTPALSGSSVSLLGGSVTVASAYQPGQINPAAAVTVTNGTLNLGGTPATFGSLSVQQGGAVTNAFVPGVSTSTTITLGGSGPLLTLQNPAAPLAANVSLTGPAGGPSVVANNLSGTATIGQAAVAFGGSVLAGGGGGSFADGTVTSPVNVNSLNNLTTGMAVYGAGVPLGATITGIRNGVNVALSQPAAAGTVTVSVGLPLTGITLTAGSYVVTVASAASIVVGSTVAVTTGGANAGSLPATARVVAVNGTQVLLSVPVAAAGTGAQTLTFTADYTGTVVTTTTGAGTFSYVTLPTAAGLAVGATVSGAGIDPGTTATAVGAAFPQITLSSPALGPTTAAGFPAFPATATTGLTAVNVLDLGGVVREFNVARSSSAVNPLTGGDLTIQSMVVNGGVLKTGDGILLLNSNSPIGSTFTGGLTITGGAVNLAGTTANSFSGGITVGGGASLVFTADNMLGVSIASNTNARFTPTNGITLGIATPPGADTAGTLIYNGTAAASSARAFQINSGGGAVNVIAAAATYTILNTGTPSATGPLTKLGAGTLVLAGNAFAGGLTINEGVAQLGSATALAPNATVAFTATAAGTFRLAGFNQTVAGLNGAAGFIDNFAAAGVTTATLTVNVPTGSASFAGSIRNTSGTGTGALSLTKTGAGTQELTGDNTFTGTADVLGGTLALGGGTATASTGRLSAVTQLLVRGGTLQVGDPTTSALNLTARLNAAATLVLGDRVEGGLGLGGGAVVFGPAGASLAQSLASLTLAPGASSISSPGGGSFVTTVTFTAPTGQFVRLPGGTLDVSEPAGSQLQLAFTTAPALTGGILGGYATVGGTTFATLSGGNVVGLASYTNDTWAAGTNTDVTTSSSVPTGSTTNSLRFNLGTTATVTLDGTNTLTSGGLLVTSAVGGSTTTITGGAITSGNGQDLIVVQNNPVGDLVIASAVADNFTSTSLTKSGPGRLVLSGANTFTGGVFVNAGTLALGSAQAIPTGGLSVVSVAAGATLDLGGNAVVLGGLTGGGTVTANSASALTITLNVARVNNADNALTFSGDLTNPLGGPLALTKSGAGTQVLAGTAAVTGAVSIVEGELSVSALGGLATGPTLTLGGAPGQVPGQLGYTGPAATLGRAVVLGSAGSRGGFDVAAGSTLTAAGGVSGSGIFYKTGFGVLALSSVGSYTGATEVQAGTLALTGANGRLTATAEIVVRGGGTLQAGDTNAALNTAPRLPAGVPVTLGDPALLGGGLVYGTGTAAVNQTLGTLTLGAGANRIGSVGGGGGSLTFAALAPRAAGSTLDLATPAAGAFTVGFAAPPPTAGGILPYATVNGTDFATVGGGLLVPFAAYVSSNSPSQWAAGDNVSVDAPMFNNALIVPNSTSPGGTLPAINSLRFNMAQGVNLPAGFQTTAATVNLTAATTFAPLLTGTILTVGSGGILVTPNVGNNPITIAGGSGITSGNGQDLIVQNFNQPFPYSLAATAPVNPALVINSLITNNPLAVIGLTKGGPGVVVLGAANQFTGNMTVADGVLATASATALNANNVVAIGNTAVLRLSNNGATSVAQTVGGLVGGPGAVVDNGVGTTVAANLTVNTVAANGPGSFNAFDGRILQNPGTTAFGLTKTGPGTQVLSGANTFTGAVTVSGGVLSIPWIANGSVVPGDTPSPLGASTAVTAVQIGGGNGGLAFLQFSGAAGSTNRLFQIGTGLTANQVATAGFDVTSGSLTLTGTVSSISGAFGNLLKTGAGTLNLTAANPFTGAVDVRAGTLALTGAGSAGRLTGATTVQVRGGGTLQTGDLNPAFNTVVRFQTAANTLTLGDAGNVLTSPTPLQPGGTLALALSTTPTAALNAPSFGSGATTITVAGTAGLQVGMVVFGTGLPAGTRITQIVGNTLTISTTTSAASSGSYTATGNTLPVTTLTVAAGANTVTAAAPAAGAAGVLQATTLARAVGGTLNVVTPSAGSLTVNVVGTAPVLTNGVLPGYATFNGTDWATTAAASAGVNLTPFTGYVTQSDPALWATANNVTNAGAAGFSGSVGTLSISTLRFNAAGVSSVSVNAGGTLTLSQSGILVTAAVGPNASTIDGPGNLTAGNSELFVHQYNTAAPLTISANITGGVALTKSGPGTLILGGATTANTFTGTLFVNDGTVRLNAAGALSRAAASPNALVLGSTGGATLQLNGFSAQVGGINGAYGAVENGAAGASTLIVNTVAVGSLPVFNGTIRDGAGGALSLVKAGLGTQTLWGTNSYSGGTVVAGGALAFNTDAALGGGGVTLTNAFEGGGVVTGLPTVSLPTLRYSGGNLLVNAQTTNSLVPLTLTRSVAVGAELNTTVAFDTAGGSLALTNLSGGSATTTLVKQGTTYALDLSNNAGALAAGVSWRVDGGLLAVANAAALGGSGAAVTLNGGTLGNTSATPLTVGGLNLLLTNVTTATAGVVNGTVGGTLVGVAVTTTGFGNVPANGDVTIAAGTVTGFGGLTKQGLGTLALTGSGAFGGYQNIDINNGVLRVDGDGSLGAASNVLRFQNVGTVGFAVLQFAAGSSALAVNRAVLLNASGAVDTNGNDVTLTNAFFAAAPGLAVNASQFMKTGAGTLTLGGLQTYTGATTILGGTLKVGSPLALPTATPPNFVPFAQATVYSANNASAFVLGNAGTLDLTNASLTVGSLASVVTNTLAPTQAAAAGAPVGGTVLFSYGGSGPAPTLTTGVNGAAATFTGSIAGTGNLLKVGAGAQTLAGTNSFAGRLDVQGGSVVLDGASATLGVSTYGQLTGVTDLKVSGGATLTAGNATAANNALLTTTTVTGTPTSGTNVISGLASVANLQVGMPVSGTGIPLGAYITAINPAGNAAGQFSVSISQNATGSAATTLTVGTPFTGFGTVSGTAVTGLTSTANFAVGDLVSGPGIPAGTRVLSVDGATALTLSQPAAAGANVTLTFRKAFSGTVSGSTITNFSNPNLIAPGALVTGTGIPAGTTVVSVSGSTVTLSQAGTAGAVTDLTFTNYSPARLNPAATLTLGDAALPGGTFTLGASPFAVASNTGLTPTIYTQQLTSLAVGPGANLIQTVGSAAGTFAGLQFTAATNQLTRAAGGGSTLNVAVPAAGTFAVNFATAPALTNGLIGGWAVFNGNDFATLVTTPGPTQNNLVAVGAAGAAVGYVTAATPGTWLPADNINVTAATGTIGTQTINSLRFGAAAIGLTVGAGNTLTVGSGGILSSSAVTGTTTIAAGSAASRLTAGAGNELIVYANQAAAVSLTIGVPLGDNGSPVGLTKAGPGLLTIGTGVGDTAGNLNTGAYYFNQGPVVLDKAGGPGRYAVNGDLFVTGGTVTANRANQINPAAAVTVINGTLSLNPNVTTPTPTATFGSLTVRQGGAVTNASGYTLTNDGTALTIGNVALNLAAQVSLTGTPGTGVPSIVSDGFNAVSVLGSGVLAGTGAGANATATGSNVINVGTAVANLAVGMTVTNSLGLLPAGTVVTAINGTAITVSQGATGPSTSGTFSFFSTLDFGSRVREVSVSRGSTALTSDLTINATIQNAGGLIKTGDGVLTLAAQIAGANTYTGTLPGGVAVDVRGGVLTLTSATGASNGFTGNVKVSGGANLIVNADAQLGATAATNNVILGDAASGTSGTLTANTAFTLNAARTITFAGPGGYVNTPTALTLAANQLAGDGALTKIGTAALVLGGANPGFTGAVNVNQGAVNYGALNALGTAAATTAPLNLNGGTLNFTAAITETLLRPVANAGVSTVSSSGNIAFNLTLAAPVTLGDTGTLILLQSGTTANTFTVAAPVSGAGNLSANVATFNASALSPNYTGTTYLLGATSQVAGLGAAAAQPVAVQATTAGGSASVTLASSTGVVLGSVLSTPALPAGTTVTAVTAPTTLTLAGNATPAAAGNQTFDTTLGTGGAAGAVVVSQGRNVAQVTGVAGLANILVGSYVNSTLFPAGTVVTAVDAGAGTVTLSNPALADGSTLPLRASLNTLAITAGPTVVLGGYNSTTTLGIVPGVTTVAGQVVTTVAGPVVAVSQPATATTTAAATLTAVNGTAALGTGPIVIGTATSTAAQAFNLVADPNPASRGYTLGNAITLTAQTTGTGRVSVNAPQLGRGLGNLLTGASFYTNPQVFTLSGSVSGVGGLNVGTAGTSATTTNAVAEVVFSGAISNTGGGQVTAAAGAILHTGPGGIAAAANTFVRLATAASLPTGNTTAAASYLAAANLATGVTDGTTGFLLGSGTFAVPAARTKFVIGGTVATLGGTLGADGTSTLGADVLVNRAAGGNMNLTLLAREDAVFTLGITGGTPQAVRFVPTTGFDPVSYAVNARPTPLSDTTGLTTFVKRGEGVVALANVAYTTAVGTPDTRFVWQIGRGAANNNYLAAASTPYDDGAVRETAAGLAGSLGDATTGIPVVFGGGVLETNNAIQGVAGFTRTLSATPAAGQARFGNGGGGFAAFGGPLTVALNSGGALTWGTTPGFLPVAEPLLLGSRTADSAVTLTNAVNLGASGTREVRVINNAASAADRGVLSGALSGAAGLLKTGDGTLTVVGTGSSYTGGTTVLQGTLEVNNSGGSGTGNGAVTVAAGGALRGTGIMFNFNPTASAVNGVLAPGTDAANASLQFITLGSVTFGTGSTFQTRLNGGTVGNGLTLTGFDQFNVLGTGTITVTGSNLLVTVGETFTAFGNDVPGLAVLANQTGNPVVGVFTNPTTGLPLNNGDRFLTADGSSFATISYFGTPSGGITGGNSVVLYSVAPVPEPVTALAVGAAGLGLLGLARRRRRAG